MLPHIYSAQLVGKIDRRERVFCCAKIVAPFSISYRDTSLQHL